MILIDPNVFTFCAGKAMMMHLVSTLARVDEITRVTVPDATVLVEPIYVNGPARLYVQGKPPEIMKRIEALQLVYRDELQEKHVLYVRFGGTKGSDVYSSLEALRSYDQTEAVTQ